MRGLLQHACGMGNPLDADHPSAVIPISISL
jgi:hypothetical protein